MKKILLLGGTSESRWISRLLLDKGCDVIGSVTTEPARRLFSEGAQEILVGKFTTEALARFLRDRKIDMVLDATHPFAETVSKKAIAVCRDGATPYLRYERPSLAQSFPEGSFSWVSSLDSVATVLQNLPGNVLVATGAKRISPFLLPDLRARVFFRLLKTELADKRIEEHALSARQIWWDEASPKPESVAEFLRENKILSAVVKDSGPQGISLALSQVCPERGVKLFVLRRPEISYPAMCSGPEALEKAFRGEHLRAAAG